jgi:hypothetical protein
LCFRPPRPGAPAKARGRRVRHWEPFTPAFHGS